MTGLIAGAVAGAILRFVVALGFLYYVSRWGGQWWGGATDMWLGALVSALIGAAIGGLAGWTCRPLLGAAVGALLSCGSCLTLFVLPARLMIAMSHPGGLDRIETAELTWGLTAMTLAGAVAGLIGATAGRRAGRAMVAPAQ
jgi:hypothetical protein